MPGRTSRSARACRPSASSLTTPNSCNCVHGAAPHTCCGDSISGPSPMGRHLADPGSHVGFAGPAPFPPGDLSSRPPLISSPSPPSPPQRACSSSPSRRPWTAGTIWVPYPGFPSSSGSLSGQGDRKSFCSRKGQS